MYDTLGPWQGETSWHTKCHSLLMLGMILDTREEGWKWMGGSRRGCSVYAHLCYRHWAGGG